MPINIRIDDQPTYSGDPAWATKVNADGPLPIADAVDKVTAEWGNAVDEALVQTNQAFNGEQVNALNVRGGVRKANTVSQIGETPQQFNLLATVATIPGDSQGHVVVAVQAQGPGGQRFFRRCEFLYVNDGVGPAVWAVPSCSRAFRRVLGVDTDARLTINGNNIDLEIANPAGTTLTWTYDAFTRVVP